MYTFQIYNNENRKLYINYDFILITLQFAYYVFNPSPIPVLNKNKNYELWFYSDLSEWLKYL